jgi:hypothetical protein
LLPRLASSPEPDIRSVESAWVQEVARRAIAHALDLTARDRLRHAARKRAS